MERNNLICGDALTVLKTLPAKAVNGIVTSAPYYGLRDYSAAGQIGLEPTFDLYIARLVEVFHEARRVLRDDGVFWLNMGDCYATSTNGRSAADTKAAGGDNRTHRDKPISTDKIKPAKNILGQPWILAFALQADGWILRQDIIWHKTNAKPESVHDRCTQSHEYVFLFSKKPRYWFDKWAIMEPAQYDGRKDTVYKGAVKGNKPLVPGNDSINLDGQRERWYFDENGNALRNRRSVWSIPTESSELEHFATFPQALITPMILGGIPPRCCAACGKPYKHVVKKSGSTYHDHGYQKACTCDTEDWQPGIVLDPFMGTGTTALVARAEKRDYLGIELNPAYRDVSVNRMRMPFEPLVGRIMPATITTNFKPNKEGQLGFIDVSER